MLKEDDLDWEYCGDQVNLVNSWRIPESLREHITPKFALELNKHKDSYHKLEVVCTPTDKKWRIRLIRETSRNYNDVDFKIETICDGVLFDYQKMAFYEAYKLEAFLAPAVDKFLPSIKDKFQGTYTLLKKAIFSGTKALADFKRHRSHYYIFRKMLEDPIIAQYQPVLLTRMNPWPFDEENVKMTPVPGFLEELDKWGEELKTKGFEA